MFVIKIKKTAVRRVAFMQMVNRALK